MLKKEGSLPIDDLIYICCSSSRGGPEACLATSSFQMVRHCGCFTLLHVTVSRMSKNISQACLHYHPMAASRCASPYDKASLTGLWRSVPGISRFLIACSEPT